MNVYVKNLQFEVSVLMTFTFMAPSRVLVLYKSARCARRDKHTPVPQTNEKEKSKAERSRSRPLSRLGDLPLYPLGGFWIDFVFGRLLEPLGEIIIYDDPQTMISNRYLSLKPTRNSPDESRGCFVYTGRKENFDFRYGSCETAHTRDSKGKERHLEAPISLMGNRAKKEEPKTNTGYA